MRTINLSTIIPPVVALWGFAMLLPAVFAGTPKRVDLKALHGPDGRLVELKPPDHGATVLIFLLARMPDLECLQSDAQPHRGRATGRESAVRRRVRRPGPQQRRRPAHLKDFGLNFPAVRDRQGLLAAKLRDDHARGVRH